MDMTLSSALKYLSATISSYTYTPSSAMTTLADLHAEEHEVYIGKMVSIPVIFVIMIAAALLPWFLQRLQKAKLSIALATCVSAGAMLGIGLLHVFPEAREVWEEYLAGHEEEVVVDPTVPVSYDAANIQSIILKSGVKLSKQALYKVMSAAGASMSVLAEEVHEAHGHAFPWTELCAGLTILFLVGAEAIVTTFLNKRGNIQHCHGHSHGFGVEEPEQVHLHAHGHTHEHKHKGAYTETRVVENSGSESPAEEVVCDGVTCEADGNNRNTDIETGVVVSTASINDPAAAPAPALVPFDGVTEPAQPVAAKVLDDDEEVHEPIDAASRARKRNIDAFISAFAICIHCFFNGLALGAYSAEPGPFWTLFGASVGHKVVDGFATGVPVFRAQLNKIVTAVIITIVAFACPLGVIIGYSVTNSHEPDLGRAVVMSISGGSFIFVALFELIPGGLASKNWMKVKIFCLFLGFAVVSIVAKWA